MFLLRTATQHGQRALQTVHEETGIKVNLLEAKDDEFCWRRAFKTEGNKQPPCAGAGSMRPGLQRARMDQPVSADRPPKP